MSTAEEEQALWEFALALYSSPGVEETVLRLQDRFAVNVNILLWACRLETLGIVLTPALLADAEASTDDWDREVVQTLRQLRRHLRGPRTELRERVKEAELLAEKESLARLARVPLPAGRERLKPGENLARLLALKGIGEKVPALIQAMRSL